MKRICFDNDEWIKYKFIEGDGEIGDCFIIYTGSDDGFAVKDEKDIIIDVDKINGFAIQGNNLKVISKLVKEFQKAENKIKERE